MRKIKHLVHVVIHFESCSIIGSIVASILTLGFKKTDCNFYFLYITAKNCKVKK